MWSLLSGPEPPGRDTAVKGDFLPAAGGRVSLCRNTPATNEDGFVSEKRALCSPCWGRGLSPRTSPGESRRNPAREENKMESESEQTLCSNYWFVASTGNGGVIRANLTMTSSGRQITHFSPHKGMEEGPLEASGMGRSSLGPDGDELLPKDSQVTGHADTAGIEKQIR